MKVIKVNDNRHLIRHWLKWYTVKRGDRWEPLNPKKVTKPVATIESAAASFKRAQPSTIPPIDLTE